MKHYAKSIEKNPKKRKRKTYPAYLRRAGITKIRKIGMLRVTFLGVQKQKAWVPLSGSQAFSLINPLIPPPLKHGPGTRK